MCPRVSVVIPTYDRADKVKRAIESVFAQTSADLEVIVVDDGSSDGTEGILRQIYGERIRYFAQVNQGVSVARNRGIAEAKGEWIAFLDSDDLWKKEKLEWQLKALERFTSECGGCYTDVQLSNNTETRTLFDLATDSYRHEETMGVNKDVLRLLVRPGGGGMVVCPSSLVARTEVVRRMGGFNPNLRFSEDSDFLFRLAMATSFCYVRLPLVIKDQGPIEARHVGVAAEWNSLEFVLRQSRMRLEGLLQLKQELPRGIRRLIRKQLGSTHSGLANCYLESSEYPKARTAISRAVQCDPTINFAMKWLLTWTSPRLARKAVRGYRDRKKHSTPIL